VELSTWVRYALPTDGVNPPTLPRRICIAGAQGFSLAASAPEGLATSLSCDFNMYSTCFNMYMTCACTCTTVTRTTLFSPFVRSLCASSRHRSV